jgi:hypothetical protein
MLYGADGEILGVNTGKSYVGILDNDQLGTMVISEETQTVASVERVQ